MAISIYNRKKQFFAPEVAGLIKQLTGFEEDDKNYQEVEKFIYSNIIHHNFATVDITVVKNTIDGYVEKFRAHGLNERAKRLRDLVDKYVASDSSQHTQLNVQWLVLWLLLNLSTKPTAVPDEDLKVEEMPELVKKEEEINWGEYLREGFEEFRPPTDDSDDEVEWLSVSGKDDKESEEEFLEEELQSFGNVPHPFLWHAARPKPTKHEVLCRIIREGMQAEQWLSNNVQRPWWSDPSHRSKPTSTHCQAHVCSIWEESQQFKSPSSDSQLLVLSEFKMLHEVLWMLQVPTEAALFHQDDNDQFHVRSNVSMPSTTPAACSSYLEKFCPFINMVYNLKRFGEILNEQEMGDNPPPVTYKAYCNALSRQLQKFTDSVISIETRLNGQDETMTLVSVMEELSPGLKVLQYLHCIHVKAITDWVSQPAWFCATKLLSVLYEIVCEASDEKLLEVSLDIFIHSFHPYLDIIDIWLSEGRLEDWRKEFLVIKEDGGLPEVMPYESEMLRCGVTPVTLLMRLVAVVTEAGSTMEVVSSLNKLSQFRDTVRNKGCLFKEFSDNVYSEIKRLRENILESTKCEKEECESVSTKSSTYVTVKSSLNNLTDEDKETQLNVSIKELQLEPLSPVSVCESSVPDVPLHLLHLSGEAMYDQTMSVLLQNPLLGEVFRGYLSSTKPPTTPPSPPPLSDKITDYSVSLVGLMSIHSVLEKQLSLVETRHKSASRLVTDTLLKEYDLSGHFTVLRNVFFMENGNLAQRFYSYLFKEIEAGTWNNVISLNAQLKVCVEECFPGFENYFVVEISKPRGDRTGSHSVHQVLPALSLAYKVDWPVSMVITEDSIENYNKVFRFLLRLKYAFWTLHNTQFSDLAESERELLVRRLYVLKTWMLHSTNTLHSYFMGLVLRSYSTHLEDSVQTAESLQVIVQAHNKFLDEVKIHCLQDKKNYLECFIKKLLNLCSGLAELWETEAVSGGDSVEAELSVLEDQFIAAYHGLIHCLEMLSPEEDRGNFLYELKCEIASSVPEHFTEEGGAHVGVSSY